MPQSCRVHGTNCYPRNLRAVHTKATKHASHGESGGEQSQETHGILESQEPKRFYGRQMVDRVVRAVEFWNVSKDCIVVAIDFAKAYDSVKFNFAEALLKFLGCPQRYVSLILSPAPALWRTRDGRGYYWIINGDPWLFIGLLTIPQVQKTYSPCGRWG